MIKYASVTIFHVYTRELPAKQMPQISIIKRQFGISVAIEVHTK